MIFGKTPFLSNENMLLFLVKNKKISIQEDIENIEACKEVIKQARKKATTSPMDQKSKACMLNLAGLVEQLIKEYDVLQATSKKYDNEIKQLKAKNEE